MAPPRRPLLPDGRHARPAMRFSALQIALGVSAALHVGVFALHWGDPQRFERALHDTPLEVILVNARGAEPPKVAQAVAQADLAGGGSADAGRATSPLPPAPQLEVGDDSADARQRAEQVRETQQHILTQLRREVAALPAPDPRRDESAADAVVQEEHRRQKVDVLAEIEKRVNDDNARPRKRYVSPATREVAYALYYDRLRRRIEERGTRDFPQNQGHKLYGELIMNITVDARGRVLETEVVRGSGDKLLDRRAQAIVVAASPYGTFSMPMLQQADQIIVTSRFRFTREDGLETSLSNARP